MASVLLNPQNVCESAVDGHPEDELHFAGATGSDSFVGSLEDYYLMNDERVLAYIRRAGPVVYERLFTQPPEEPEELLRHRPFPFAIEGLSSVSSPDGSTAIRTLVGVGETLRTTEFRQDLVLMQEKRRIYQLLMKDRLLLLQSTSWLDNATCSNPACIYALCTIPTGAYTLSLESTTGVTSGLGSSVTTRTHLYCLTCVERIFDTVETDVGDRNPILPQAVFDGTIDTALVLREAARLMLSGDHNVLVELTSTMSEDPLPSNCGEAIVLRHQRNQETDEILRRVIPYERREVNQSPTSPSLVIVKPLELSQAPLERYKKQGLTRYYKAKESRKASYGSHSNAKSPTSQNGFPSPGWSDDLEPLWCYCREPENDEDMICCSSEYCLIGWVHRRCSGLLRLPYLNELWFCKICSEGLVASANEGGFDTVDHHQSGDQPAFKAPATHHAGGYSSEIPQDHGSDSEDFYEDEDDLSSHKLPQTPTMIPSLPTSATPFQFLDGQATPVGTCPLSQGAPNLKFSDLAPFIVARLRGRLGEKHLAAIEGWKLFCPPSRIADPSVGNTFPSRHIRYRNLSHVLSEVDRSELFHDLLESQTAL